MLLFRITKHGEREAEAVISNQKPRGEGNRGCYFESQTTGRGKQRLLFQITNHGEREAEAAILNHKVRDGGSGGVN